MWNRLLTPASRLSAQLSSVRNASSSGTRTVTLIPGDGIGPEIAVSVQK